MSTTPAESVAIVELLLERGGDPNAKDYRGATPLHRALIQTHVDQSWLKTYPTNFAAIELLLKRGADVNARDNDRYTPLHYAVVAAGGKGAAPTDPDLIKLLLAHGADRTAKTSHGKTPLDMAQYIKPPEARERITKALGE